MHHHSLGQTMLKCGYNRAKFLKLVRVKQEAVYCMIECLENYSKFFKSYLFPEF